MTAAVEWFTGERMGTRWTVKFARPADASPTPALPALRAAVERELDLVIAQMSVWDADSDLSRFNRAPAGHWQTLPEPLFEVLDCALDLAARSAGAYDPTVAPLVRLWGFGAGQPRDERPQRPPPRAEAIAEARARMGWQRLQLDRERRALRQPGGIELDLSSIAKGHAVDRVVACLAALGIRDALVDIGGELRASGQRPDGQPWRIAIEPPDLTFDAELPPRVLALREQAVATSGDSWHVFECDGRRYGHTLDPRSGWPLAHRLAAVTVLHASCMRADALATWLAVLGADAGLALAERLGIAALFVERDERGGSERFSSAMAPLLDAA
ncbi:FAD:protein FMN transferase [Derxia lacustris]|uniref:FAD:protein FMN transferase n=1 Tax=Derxia lacustris TaxID=764842 RepID=UPI001F369365|nr:FAD:protein FMN transferase [Derxia lacustris]